MGGVTQKARLELGKAALDLLNEAALKLVLVDDSYAHDDTRDFVDDGTADDVASHEIVVSGYTGGFGGASRLVPANRLLRRDDGNLEIEFDFDDVVWATLAAGVTIGGVALIVEKTTDADSWVIAYDTMLGDVATDGTDVTYTPSTEGMFKY